MADLADIVDRAIELAVVPSFSAIGPAVRRRLDDWVDPADADRADRTIVITGATSGIGRAAAEALCRSGARLLVVGRDAHRTAQACADIARTGGSHADRVQPVVADLGELDQVRRACDEIATRADHLDVLIHNAGALSSSREMNRDGIEMTVAAQVVGPFLMTASLLDLLRSAPTAPARVITMSSGGMYTAPLCVDDLEMPVDEYQGTKQYARAKRAQVTLTQMWADRVPEDEVVFHAMHPGWADTPGIADALPGFHRLVGPLLRSAEQAADTLVWLSLDDGEPIGSTGGFWLDRRRRPLHRLGATRRSDTPHRRAELWRWIEARAGVAGPAGTGR